MTYQQHGQAFITDACLYNLNNMTWKKANIIIDGQKMEVPAPDIISASRSTDIPAFYADWFFHRLGTGYSVWNNPFNGKRAISLTGIQDS